MSCCTTDTKCSSALELKKLEKFFDSVSVDSLSKYRLLTLKDKSKNSKMDWIVWLQVKLPYGYSNGHRSATDDELLARLVKAILPWINLLVNFDSIGKQEASLFQFETTEELKEEPPSPGPDGNWNKYFKDRDNVRIHNIKKTYSFFEVVNLIDKTFVYSDNDYRHLLPKTDDEMINIIKKEIIKACEENLPDETYGWRDDSNYICSNGSLSDLEIISRVKHLLRVDLVSYVEEARVFCDDSYNHSIHEKSIRHRFIFDGNIIETSFNCDQDKLITPHYNIYTDGFISWLREYFNIQKIPEIDDDTIIGLNLRTYFRRLIGHNKCDYQSIINSSKDWKSFKVSLHPHIEKNNNGGGSGIALDSYRGGYSIDQKGHVEVTQRIEDRVKLNRSTSGLKHCERNGENLIIANLRGDDIYKSAFSLLKDKSLVQQDLFSFLAS